MKRIIEVDIPDGFEVTEDQESLGYMGQSALFIKLTPVSDDAKNTELETIERMGKQFKTKTN